MPTGTVLSLLLLAAVVGWAVSTYNRLIAYRNGYRNAFAQIDVQLKRRHDLIPNLVKATQGYLRHERETLEAVVAARHHAEHARASAARQPIDASAIDVLDRSEATLGTAVGRLFAVAEAHPQLKADASVAQLTEELRGTENRIGFARQAFNDAVTDYNDAIARFPANLIASLFSFRAATLLRATRMLAEREPFPVDLRS